jgi:hypothetical protein
MFFQAVFLLRIRIDLALRKVMEMKKNLILNDFYLN